MARKLFIPVLALLCCVSCSSIFTRRIPKDTLARIYADMYVADQWFVKNRDELKKTDTLAVYEPIMKRYGYDFADYDKTVRWYVDRPEKMLKVMMAARSINEKKLRQLENYLEIQERNKEFERKIQGVYDPEIFWPALLDSVNYSINAQRRDSVRTDSKPEVGKILGNKSLANKREGLQF